LYGIITNDQFEGRLTAEHLELLANVLEMPQIADEELNKIRQQILEGGYKCRMDLTITPPTNFSEQVFGELGTGDEIYRKLTGKRVKTEGRKCFTRDHLNKIADMLFGVESLDEKNKYWRELILNAGYPDRFSFEYDVVRNFMTRNFGNIGQGAALYATVTGKRSGYPRRRHLQEIADIVFGPTAEEDRLNWIRAILQQNGYYTAADLENASLAKFMDQDFGILGKGRAVCSFTTNTEIGSRPLNRNDLREISQILFRDQLKEKLLCNY
jgi:hypothetical protein